MGRRPKLKSDEKWKGICLEAEIISLLSEIAGDKRCSYWRRDPIYTRRVEGADDASTMFTDEQHGSLADQMQDTLMLKYNKRVVG